MLPSYVGPPFALWENKNIKNFSFVFWLFLFANFPFISRRWLFNCLANDDFVFFIDHHCNFNSAIYLGTVGNLKFNFTVRMLTVGLLNLWCLCRDNICFSEVFLQLIFLGFLWKSRRNRDMQFCFLITFEFWT